MPGFGKSGTSRISFFKWSQFASVFADVFAITMPLQCEMWLNLQPALLQLPEHRQPERPADLVAAATATPTTDLGSPSPELLHCRRCCYEPTRRRRACALRARHTIGTQRLERARGQQIFVIGFPCRT